MAPREKLSKETVLPVSRSQEGLAGLLVLPASLGSGNFFPIRIISEVPFTNY
jgi:hypothetical protein